MPGSVWSFLHGGREIGLAADIKFKLDPPLCRPKANEIQLGSTLKFFIERLVIEPADSYDKTLEVAQEIGNSIMQSFADYQECFDSPAEFTGEVENI